MNRFDEFDIESYRQLVPPGAIERTMDAPIPTVEELQQYKEELLHLFQQYLEGIPPLITVAEQRLASCDEEDEQRDDLQRFITHCRDDMRSFESDGPAKTIDNLDATIDMRASLQDPDEALLVHRVYMESPAKDIRRIRALYQRLMDQADALGIETS